MLSKGDCWVKDKGYLKGTISSTWAGYRPKTHASGPSIQGLTPKLSYPQAPGELHLSPPALPPGLQGDAEARLTALSIVLNSPLAQNLNFILIDATLSY